MEVKININENKIALIRESNPNFTIDDIVDLGLNMIMGKINDMFVDKVFANVFNCKYKDGAQNEVKIERLPDGTVKHNFVKECIQPKVKNIEIEYTKEIEANNK